MNLINKFGDEENIERFETTNETQTVMSGGENSLTNVSNSSNSDAANLFVSDVLNATKIDSNLITPQHNNGSTIFSIDYENATETTNVSNESTKFEMDAIFGEPSEPSKMMSNFSTNFVENVTEYYDDAFNDDFNDFLNGNDEYENYYNNYGGEEQSVGIMNGSADFIMKEEQPSKEIVVIYSADVWDAKKDMVDNLTFLLTIIGPAIIAGFIAGLLIWMVYLLFLNLCTSTVKWRRSFSSSKDLKPPVSGSCCTFDDHEMLEKVEKFEKKETTKTGFVVDKRKKAAFHQPFDEISNVKVLSVSPLSKYDDFPSSSHRPTKN